MFLCTQSCLNLVNSFAILVQQAGNTNLEPMEFFLQRFSDLDFMLVVNPYIEMLVSVCFFDDKVCGRRGRTDKVFHGHVLPKMGVDFFPGDSRLLPF